MKHCLIIGSGIAGLNAASLLASKNISVTILESSPKLGGRTYSFLETQTNQIVDNGQHLLMGCYKDSLAFIKLTGAEDNFSYQKNLNVKFINRDRKIYSLNASSFPYPFNLLNAVLNYDVLNFSSKIKFIRFLVSFRFISESALSNLTVSDWLEKENQNDTQLKNLWEILCVGTLNTSISKASALVFYRILKLMFLKGNYAATLILPKYGLSESIVNPASEYIKKHGGKIFTSEPVKKIEISNNKIETVTSDKKVYKDFDFVISAVPHYALEKIIDVEILDIDVEFEYSTILNIHIWIDDLILDEMFYGLLNSPLHWIFNKGDHINVVISDADYLAEKSKDEILNLIIDELSIYTSIKKENITNYKIIKEKRATFVPDKNSLSKRPQPTTKIKNLILAGDWIDTGLPSTIESAAKSGRLAADIVLSEINKL